MKRNSQIQLLQDFLLDKSCGNEISVYPSHGWILDVLYKHDYESAQIQKGN